MASNLRITGYCGTVWNAALDVLAYYTATLDPSNTVAAQNLTNLTAKSIKNAIEALNAISTLNQAYNNYLLLTEAFAVPVAIDATSVNYIQNRLKAMQVFSSSLTRFNVSIIPPATALLENTPSIPTPGLVEYLSQFEGEALPSDYSTLLASAKEAYTSWTALADALTTGGVAYSGASYDAVTQMAQASQVVYQMLVNGGVAPLQSAAASWNGMVAIPSIVGMAALTAPDPTSLQQQNLATAKYILGTTLYELNQVLLSLRDQVSGNIQLAVVHEDDVLMDVAARRLGDYEQWTSIATTNNLAPPYATAAGTELFLPTTGTVQTQGTAPSYTLNYLGVDLYYGPLNQDMLPWTGDFNTISGYENLAFSLGRRMQTTYGDLIYHLDFGSRIPPEVGAVTEQTTLAYIGAYARSCVLSDPRVNRVLSADVQALQNYAINARITVLPNGLGSKSATVNEVIGPLS